MTSIVLQISKIHYKLSEVCSLNYASPEPEPVLTHLSVDDILKNNRNAERTIIFCRNLQNCADICVVVYKNMYNESTIE